ncbi:hypothetical protein FHG87_015140 [Trinorchestia longiramus]|nr:hypothetical protein FHG87_015140 [Trinorchestia longiramus]
MNTNSLRQHMNKPTRRNNIIDLVITAPDLSINGLEVTAKIGDLQMIDFMLEVHDPNTWTRQKQVLDYKWANRELMKEDLGNNDYEVLIRNKNAGECYMVLKEKNCNYHRVPYPKITVSESSVKSTPMACNSHKAFTERDRVTIQSDLNRLLQWTETWQMNFNNDKCSVMHVGANNQHFQHTMNDIHIEAVQQQ